ncbi:hypothetical protein [Mycolicibacterium hodleri]|uniref:Uncharacterized protein n=1 Tax=Mycolicibacterium hodleri TaxID=49897 RepID=A0A502EKN8_9MYCO|nr:hypothetical protein [Mycolicibacterium hodleri]TPG37090.1 hypothetical protein EAH80_04320 [Mycolicibacterium hodleri]
MTSVSTIKNRIATAAALATFGLAALPGALAGPANADTGAAASSGSESSRLQLITPARRVLNQLLPSPKG